MIEPTSAWRLAPGVVAQRELEMAASVLLVPLAQRVSERDVELLRAVKMPSVKSGQTKDAVAKFDARVAESIAAEAVEHEAMMAKQTQ